MIMPEGRVLVRVDMKQKSQYRIGNLVFKTTMRYETNYREKSPVVAEVAEGNNILKEGNVIICHHNHFYPPSPYFVMDDLYSIPFNKTIFAVLSKDSSIKPVCGNILGEQVDVESDLLIPPSDRKKHKNRLKVTHGGDTKYRPGDLIFTRPSAPYEIVYIVDSIEYRISKVSEDMVVGVEKKYYC